MSPPQPRGFLATFPLRLTRWSRALLIALKTQAIEVARWFSTILLKSFRWLSTSYNRIETSILETAVDIALALVAIRYFLLIVVIGFALLMWNIWAFLLFVLFVCVAVLRFFGPDDTDVQQQTEFHIQSRSNIIQWLRWPLRALASGAIIFFTSSITLLSPVYTEIRPAFDSFSTTPSLGSPMPKEAIQAPSDGEEIEQARLKADAKAKREAILKDLKDRANVIEKKLAARQAKLEADAKALSKAREEASAILEDISAAENL